MAWRGDIAFRHKDPRLFAMSNQKEAMVADILVDNEEGKDWIFSWRHRFFVWEEGILVNLLEDFNGHVGLGGVDEWRWRLEEHGSFSVRSIVNGVVSNGTKGD